MDSGGGQLQTPQAPTSHITGKKVLIVEDDFYIRDLYSMTAKEEGFIVTEASNGEEALFELRSDAPDIILLDIMLPDMNGMTILKTVKETEELKHIPVIIVTNLDESAKEQEAMSLGAAEYLTKIRVTPIQVIDTAKKYC